MSDIIEQSGFVWTMQEIQLHVINTEEERRTKTPGIG